MSNLDTSKYFEERLQAPDFKSSFIEMLSTLRDEIGARSVQEVCNDISFLFDQRRPDLQKAVHSMACDLNEIIIGQITKSGYAGKDVLNTFSQESLRSVVLQPIEIPKETLEEIIDQPAIRELLNTIIYSSIINFWKKINPLLGAVAATAAEKQIRDFIKPFLPTAIEMIVEFLTEEKNHDMMIELNGSVFDILLEQRADLLNHLPTEQTGKLVKEAGFILIEDEVLHEKIVEQKNKVFEQIISLHGEKTLSELLAEHGLNLESIEINDREFELVQKAFLGTGALKSFMIKELELFAKSGS